MSVLEPALARAPDLTVRSAALSIESEATDLVMPDLARFSV